MPEWHLHPCAVVVILEPKLLASRSALQQLQHVVVEVNKIHQTICPVLLGVSARQCLEAAAPLEGLSTVLHQLLQDCSTLCQAKVQHASTNGWCSRYADSCGGTRRPLDIPAQWTGWGLDQGCALHTQAGSPAGSLAQQVAAGVIKCLVAAKQLHPAYGSGARNQLAKPPRLLGRDQELSEVLEALASDRQLVIVGGPGEGKSALAAATAYHLWDAGELPGGVCVIDLKNSPSAGGPKIVECALP
jgi:hypothetical protein